MPPEGALVPVICAAALVAVSDARARSPVVRAAAGALDAVSFPMVNGGGGMNTPIPARLAARPVRTGLCGCPRAGPLGGRTGGPAGWGRPWRGAPRPRA